MTAPETAQPQRNYSAERSKAFIDAVVAIAMTLLILPLMESVTEVAGAKGSTAGWFAEHQGELTSFIVSFAIIAMFWLNHHRLFTAVEQVDSALLWISMAWLLTIVWLPVATALSGRMDGSDWLAKIVYIGSMIVTALVTLIQRVYLRRHRDLHHIADADLRSGMAADLAMCVLFGVALLVAVTVPSIGYLAMFLMLLMGPMQRLTGALVARTTR